MNKIRTTLLYILLLLLSIPFSLDVANAQTDTEFWFAAPFIIQRDRGNRRMDRPILVILYTKNQPASVEIS